MKKIKRKKQNKQRKIIVIFFIGLLFIMTVGYAAFQTNLNISVKGNILEKSRIIQSWTGASQEDFHSDYYKENILTITFLDTNEIPSNATESWDVSEDGKGGVIAYVVPTTKDTTKYDLYIGAKGGVIANEDSSTLFANFKHTTNINFNENFDTSNTMNMSRMFQSCINLLYLDLSDFNTKNVTDMSLMFNSWNYTNNPMKLENIIFGTNFSTENVTNMYGMFAACTHLKTLDVSKFDTSNVINMKDMFSACQQLTDINISHFNTQNVTNMHGMFYDCQNIDNLDLSNFNTSSVTDMSLMFSNCYKLSVLNLCSFNTKNVTTMGSIFYGTKNLTKISVGSNWITENAITTNMFINSGVSEVTTGRC